MLFTTALLALSSAITVSAFTNGSLVPAYICDPTPDGLPKNYGQVLALTRKQVHQLAFTANKGQDNLNVTLNPKTNGTLVGNTAYILAAFHNTLNNLEAIPQGVIVTTASGGPLKAGASNALVLSSGAVGVALDGVLAYGQDPMGVRQGTFTEMDNQNIFIPFAGCGINPQGKVAGVIQQMTITENETYSGLAYNAPACVPGGNLTLAGLSVTDNGFGVWSYSFAVTGSNCTNTTVTRPTTPSTSPAMPAAPAMVSVNAGTKRVRRFLGVLG